MTYDLYTVPRCDGCKNVKEFLDRIDVEYNVFNLKELDDKRHFGKNGYMQISENLRKNVQNQAILPILR